MKGLVDTAIQAAREAGEALLRGYGGALDVARKGDRSLVTNLDRESEKIIVGRIRSAYPSHSILAEEGNKGADGGEFCWVVDPLDGTHNFIRQTGNFGVSIGVVRGDEFAAGVIFLPLDDAMYVAEKGSGAYRNGRRISVSDTPSLGHCTLCYDSSIRSAPDRICGVYRSLGTRVFNVRVYGSSVRTLTYVAEGRVDLAVEFDDKPWDFAAGLCLVQEAGGRVTGLDGARVLCLAAGGYVASNGLVHDEAVRVVGEHSSER